MVFSILIPGEKAKKSQTDFFVRPGLAPALRSTAMTDPRDPFDR